MQREKKNMQESEGVYVFNVPEREELDHPTARLIKDLSCIEGEAVTTNANVL
jgi:ATP-dependent DNA helicase 2 subunit 1